jgi:hypothetical protein
MKTVLFLILSLLTTGAFAGTLTCQLEKSGSTGYAPSSKVIEDSKQAGDFKKNPYPHYLDYMVEWIGDEYSYGVTVDETVRLTLTELRSGAEAWTSMEKNSKNFYQIMLKRNSKDDAIYLRCSIKL